MTGSSFAGAQLVGPVCAPPCSSVATWRQAFLTVLLTCVVFYDCRLSGADLSGSRLVDVRFRECRLVDASLRMTSGTRVRFEHCDLGRLTVYVAQLLGACFFDSTSQARAVASDIDRGSSAGSRFPACEAPPASGGP